MCRNQMRALDRNPRPGRADACKRRIFQALVIAVGLAGAPTPGWTKNILKITSTPSGATVKFNDVVVGTTPFEVEYPGGYFHETKTVLGKRLLEPIKAKVVKDGYIEAERELTKSMGVFRNVYGMNFGNYWLLTSASFHFDLQPVSPLTISTSTAPSRSAATHTLTEDGPIPDCATAEQSGELTLETGQVVAFDYLRIDKDGGDGSADRNYRLRGSCRPNMRYGEDLTENWTTRSERLSKLVFEDVVKIEFLPFTKTEMDLIGTKRTCVDVGCADRRAAVTFRDGTRKDNIVIYLGDSPHYAITSESRYYNLTDYDVKTVMINRK